MNVRLKLLGKKSICETNNISQSWLPNTKHFVFSSSIMTPGYLHSGLKVQRHAWQGAAILTAVKLSSERSPGASPPLSLSLCQINEQRTLSLWSMLVSADFRPLTGWCPPLAPLKVSQLFLCCDWCQSPLECCVIYSISPSRKGRRAAELINAVTASRYSSQTLL